MTDCPFGKKCYIDKCRKEHPNVQCESFEKECKVAGCPKRHARRFPPAATPRQEAEDSDTELWGPETADTPYESIPDADPEAVFDEEKDAKGSALRDTGNVLMDAGKYEAAITTFTEALKLCPGKAPFWACRAHSHTARPQCPFKIAPDDPNEKVMGARREGAHSACRKHW